MCSLWIGILDTTFSQMISPWVSPQVNKSELDRNKETQTRSIAIPQFTGRIVRSVETHAFSILEIKSTWLSAKLRLSAWDKRSGLTQGRKRQREKITRCCAIVCFALTGLLRGHSVQKVWKRQMVVSESELAQAHAPTKRGRKDGEISRFHCVVPSFHQQNWGSAWV